MELHTLGVDNGYTQQDVIELARTLTGWTCGWKETDGGVREYRFFFKEARHDHNPTTVVGVQLDGTGGLAEGEKVIRHLANHEGTSRFLAGKLCRYLVNDVPPSDLVERVGSVFLKTGGNLTDVYRAIIFSPEFLDARNYRVKFKTPFEYTVSALRATEARIESCEGLLRELKLMGQPLYECDVPTGYSDQAEAWLDPGVMVYRWNFAIQLLTGKIRGVQVPLAFYQPLLKLSRVERMARVKDLFLPGLNEYKTDRTLGQAPDVPSLIALALGSPSFQQQ
jgi:uncharacterized protein (DUF1800 family)